MKKLLTTVVVLFLALQSFSQLTYFNRTGRGFSVGGAYSHTSKYGISVNSFGGAVSARFLRGFSVSLEYLTTDIELRNNNQAHALIPSITFQIPNDRYLGIAVHAGYTDSYISVNKPGLLLGLEAYRRINSENRLQVIPHASASQLVLLKDAYYDPELVLGLGLNLAIRLGLNAFIVAGPSVSFSGGESNLTWEVGLVTQ